ncbi:MAG: glutamate-5-semialdehyde dehydrogenase [Deltaproteobacteria bacterium]|nr:glutamate-5-semialdehyde dehydrogenase [Deltaproteobacteria bacterium]
MEIREQVEKKVTGAKNASRGLARLGSAIKNKALLRMADRLVAESALLKQENAKDLAAGREKGLTAALLDRLELNDARIAGMAEGLRQVAALPDPVGEVLRMWKRPNDLRIGKIRVPIGVIGIIYESRPNVTADAAGLCLKAGNAVVLRGGSEAIHSNSVIARILSDSAVDAGVPEGTVQFIDVPDREAVMQMLKMDRYIDLIIPRGGEGLIRTVCEHSTIPVIKHDKGVCHTYIDSDADLEMARRIALNAKCQRPGVCNAMETLLVHRKVADTFLPEIGSDLAAAGVEIRGCPETQKRIKGCREATEADWTTEYNDLILSIRVVDSMTQAVEHITRYGSEHSEAIVTKDYRRARRFLAEVDASAVYVNASTRFTDGFEFGFGAEIGISTNRLHARGPVGLEELTIYKYIILGDGQTRE